MRKRSIVKNSSGSIETLSSSSGSFAFFGAVCDSSSSPFGSATCFGWNRGGERQNRAIGRQQRRVTPETRDRWTDLTAVLKLPAMKTRMNRSLTFCSSSSSFWFDRMGNREGEEVSFFVLVVDPTTAEFEDEKRASVSVIEAGLVTGRRIQFLLRVRIQR